MRPRNPFVKLATVYTLNQDAEVCLIRLSAPLKSAFAREHGLDYEALLTAGPYKEKYRESMVKWGEEKRKSDAGYFINLATAELTHAQRSKGFVIVTDCRRKSDFEYFKSNFGEWPLCTVRIHSNEAVRKERGFVFQSGIDDAETECDLDDYAHNFLFDNSMTNTPITTLVEFLLNF